MRKKSSKRLLNNLLESDCLTVLIVIVLLLVLLLCLPVGVDVSFCEGVLRTYLRVGSFTFCVYPHKTTSPKTKTANEQETLSLPDCTKDEVLDGIGVLVRAIKKLKFHLHKLKLHFISAFDDPYNTAMCYGYASAAASALGLTALKQSDVQLGVDFEREHYYFDGYVSITIRIYYIMKFVGCVIWGGIPIILRRQKRLKQEHSTAAMQGKET